MKFNLVIFLVTFFLSTLCYAQPSWEIGGFGGSTGYMGDLNPITPYKLMEPSFGGFVKRNFDGFWGLKFAIMHGEITANDSFSKNIQFNRRNINFFTPLTELSFQTEFNFFNYIPGEGKKRYSPYLLAGIGFVNFNPKARYDGVVYELNPYGTEGQDPANSYNTTVLSIPFGAGIKYNVTGTMTLGAEIGYRTAYTDYLDDVSGKYAPGLTGDRAMLADPSVLKSTPRTNTPGSQRGDYRKHDTYLFAGFTLSYSIFNHKCPVAQ